MDHDPNQDIYVAPLYIKKAADAASAGDPATSTEEAQPDTQNLASTNVIDEETAQPTFQNYLRAIYPFSPSTALSPSTVTLSLNAGDLILVHSVHTNGWADGTLLESGARGWLPTNYCEAYEQEPMRPLLKGLTEFWDLIRSGSTSTVNLFRNQDYMRGLIAGVRFLLERSDCLTRDSLLVKANERLRKTRKALLSDLSLLVKASKRLQEAMKNPQAGYALDDVLDEMLLKAFTIVIRAVRFLEIWTDCVRPAMPVTSGGMEDEFILTHTQQDSVVTYNFPVHNTALRQSRPQKDGASTTPETINFSSPTRVARPTSVPQKRQSVTHRMSYSGQSAGYQSQNLASEQLSRCYDAFLGVLASFLGSHLQSRSSSELLLTTQHAVRSCRELLGVVELVLENNRGQSEMLLEAKDAMYDRITELVHAARDVFRPVSLVEDDSIFLPEDGKQLLNAATACVRVAGECVAKTRLVLQQIGDFELNPHTQRSSTASLETADSSVIPLPHERSASTRPSTAMSRVGAENESSRTVPTRPYLEIPEPTHPPPGLVLSSVPNSALEKSLPPTPTNRAHPGSDSPTLGTATDIPSDEIEAAQLKRQKSLARNVVISTGSDDTYISSVRNSSVVSGTSTRATSPESHSHDLPKQQSVASFAESQAELTDEIDETEAKLMVKTFAHELMYNKDGQVIGGTLNALVEKLTAHDSTPDALFVSTFYLTFRLFVSPQTFADTLSERFEYIGEALQFASPVRLRVYNVFKGWLESHWRHDCDSSALPNVVRFARNILVPVLPAAGKRLLELTEQVSVANGPLVPRLISAIGKTNTSIATYVSPDTPVPEPTISRSQLLSLRTWKMGGSVVSILDFDPLELARQITLKASGLFCSILPEELLATEWTKRSGSLAVNVRAMSTLSTDLTNLVADSILMLEEPKKRASVIKQWVKIAGKCLELNNFDTLMAIICSLNSTTILRLKRTWDIVSQKTKNTLESLSKVVEFSRNHVVLRQRLQDVKPPCLPFVGMYLTDLTFVDHGNQGTRQLQTESGTTPLINFDKHMKTAKVISDLQRFQVPYRFQEVPELQTWMQDQLVRVRSAEEGSFQNHYRRSLILEPREQTPMPNAPSPIDGGMQKEKDKFDFLAWTHISKEKNAMSSA